MSVAFIACAKVDKAAPTMKDANPQPSFEEPTNNGVSQLKDNNARASVTDTGAQRGTVPSTGSATSTSRANRGANSDSTSRRNGTAPATHP